MGKDLIVDGTLPETNNFAFHSLMFLIAGIAMITDRPRVHAPLGYGSLVLMGTYIWLLFARLH